jgi:hypothetical protein
MIRLVAEQGLAVLEAHAGHSQPMAKRVLQVMHPDVAKSVRTGFPQLTQIAIGGAAPR